MTEDRKQELTQLLHEAMGSLTISPRSPNRFQLPVLDVHAYRDILKQYWKYHSFDPIPIVKRYELHIGNETVESKLLDFIRVEFAPCIQEDSIQSASFFIGGSGSPSGYPLDYLLNQLLKIAIVHGMEGALQEFERCTQNEDGYFEYIALLEGIKLEAAVQVFEGIKLISLPNTTSELQHYLSDFILWGDQPSTFQPSVFCGKTLLIIDASVSPIFHKPFPEIFREGFKAEHIPFKSKIVCREFPNLKVENFYEQFCRVLSLSCNSAVQYSRTWKRLAEDELFNLHSMRDIGITTYYKVNQIRNDIMIGESHIDEAKHLYNLLTNLNTGTLEELQIPIDRWIKSKTSVNPVDKIIDLGIALEALYLSETDYNREIRFRFSLHAAWHLGKEKEHRKELMKEFKAIYDWRSTVVHTGKLRNKTKRTPFTPEETEAFITNAQDLCRDSIMKILVDGKFPDWNDLILGEESS